VFQRLLSVALVVITVIWIVFSHVASLRGLLPVVAYPAGGRWMAAAALLSLGLFLAVQLRLLWATVTGVRRYMQAAPGDAPPLSLRFGLEVLWTVLPVVMTLGLAWAAYGLWTALAAP
jgi:hypothetical protein